MSKSKNDSAASTKYNLLLGLLPIILAIALLTILALALLMIERIEAGNFFRDPIAILWANSNIDNPLVGVFSQIGSVLWLSGTTMTGLTAYLCWQSQQKRLAYFLTSVAAIGIVLGIDDMFLLHDYILSEYFSLNEKVIFGTYGLLILLIGIYFREEILQGERLYLVLTVLFFGASLVVDRGFISAIIEDMSSEGVRIFLEDGLKFVGIATFWTYNLRLSLASFDEIQSIK